MEVLDTAVVSASFDGGLRNSETFDTTQSDSLQHTNSQLNVTDSLAVEAEVVNSLSNEHAVNGEALSSSDSHRNDQQTDGENIDPSKEHLESSNNAVSDGEPTTIVTDEKQVDVKNDVEANATKATKTGNVKGKPTKITATAPKSAAKKESGYKATPRAPAAATAVLSKPTADKSVSQAPTPKSSTKVKSSGADSTIKSKPAEVEKKVVDSGVTSKKNKVEVPGTARSVSPKKDTEISKRPATATTSSSTRPTTAGTSARKQPNSDANTNRSVSPTKKAESSQKSMASSPKKPTESSPALKSARTRSATSNVAVTAAVNIEPGMSDADPSSTPVPNTARPLTAPTVRKSLPTKPVRSTISTSASNATTNGNAEKKVKVAQPGNAENGSAAPTSAAKGTGGKKDVRSKIGSLENANRKPSGGNVKIFSSKSDFKNIKSRVGTLDKVKPEPASGDVAVQNGGRDEQLPDNATAEPISQQTVEAPPDSDANASASIDPDVTVNPEAAREIEIHEAVPPAADN